MLESSVTINLHGADGRARQATSVTLRIQAAYPHEASRQAELGLTPFELAAAENRATRIAWGERPEPRRFSQKNVAEKVRPYLGSGLSRSEVARRIGCSRPAVSDALKKIGGEL